MKIDKVIHVLLIVLLATSTSICQDDEDYTVYDDEIIRKGLTLGIGFGAGYSKHADSYEESLYGLHEFSGIRAIVIETKLGWRLADSFEVLASLQYAPSNATISPYRSLYYSGALAYYFKSYPRLSLNAGYGKYISNISKLGSTGSGNLYSGGLSWQASGSFFFDLKILGGKMDIANLEPNPFGASEFNISFGVACKY